MFVVKKELIFHLEKLGLPLSNQGVSALLIHFNQVEEWGNKLGLTHSTGEDLLLKHTLDSLLALPFFSQHSFSTIVDIGSGAGFPGLCLASCLPNTQFILVERKQKRLGFLTATLALMGLKNAKVVEGLDKVKPSSKETTALTFRALTQLNPKTTKEFLQYGITLVAYKGRLQEVKKEASLLADFKTQIIKLKAPFKEERCLLVVE